MTALEQAITKLTELREHFRESIRLSDREHVDAVQEVIELLKEEESCGKK